ncbi:MAG: DUF4405 domain-containing protein [Deltaproteobacteria bacterium]|nr:DUF4405 domain-containing protein [Candidatus Anaeroferrophillus wilburensis]MBN2888618.1 DUF4405 domain-containing protein [Deltaproteobacteria bacterium]
MNGRKITSLTLVLSGILLLLTSIMLYISPHGRVAYWTDWHLWGISRPQWGSLHINLGLLFLLAGVLHAFYNWKPIMAYLKNKARELRVFTLHFNLALGLVLVVTLGTYWEMPPMSSVIGLGDLITAVADEKYGEPPYGHAELSSLKMFVKKTNLDLEKAKELLQAAGVELAGDQQTIGDLARANKMTPKALYAIMKPAEIKTTGMVFPDAPAPGFGRRLLADVCAEFNLDLPTVVQSLKAQGMTVDPAASIIAIAERNGVNPMTVFEILRQVATGS